MLLRNLSWSQHGIQMQERIPLPQSISMVSSSLQRMLLGNLSWSDHGIQMQESILPPQSFCGISSGNKITPVEKDGKADAKMGFHFGQKGQLS
jgi:hypothetical protein